MHLAARVEPDQRASQVPQVGMKAAGLGMIPSPWTPPFFVIATAAYQAWSEADEGRSNFLEGLAEEVIVGTSAWQTEWGSGILLRSSAVGENLGSRGRNETIELPGDFNRESVSQAIQTIFEQFLRSDIGGSIAVIVQARVPVQVKGHASNERRVSITENQWMFEVEQAREASRRFNSQRASPPVPHDRLRITAPLERSLIARFREVGRWCTLLDQGRAHLEWGATTDTLWLFQLDFEDDLPDEGHHPEELLRGSDLKASGTPPLSSPFRSVDLSSPTGWRKIDKIADFVVGRSQPYPKLFWITGDKLAEALEQKVDLQKDLTGIVHGRAICRTDCRSTLIPSLNLPRTESVSEAAALNFMSDTLTALGIKGARTDEVCFILHKFIPATAAAWAVAHPGKQIVRVDSLWGLPDGLQYLPHDTFEFDVVRNEISAERIRFKPKFLQETSDGSWRVIEVGRRFTRYRSLSKPDLAEVAVQTHAICQRIGQPIQIMWFCGIPTELEMGRNVPWFSMPPEKSSGPERSISPTMPRFAISGIEDLNEAAALEAGKYVLYINPENPELFRSTDFLALISKVAGAKQFPVAIAGSILSHAFYMLDREGIGVVAVDEPGRSRTRQRRVFNKMVRDQIPDQISEHGERTALATIAKSEARPALAVKLLEELFELLGAQTPGEVTAELADVLEVVRSLCAATGVSWAEVEVFAAAKRAKRGSFDRNVVLVETSWPTRGDEAGPRKPINIKLANLGKVTSDGSVHTVPFSILLAHGGDREVILSDGKRLVVTMDGSGIRILEGELAEAASGQFEFDLRSPKSQ